MELNSNMTQVSKNETSKLINNVIYDKNFYQPFAKLKKVTAPNFEMKFLDLVLSDTKEDGFNVMELKKFTHVKIVKTNMVSIRYTRDQKENLANTGINFENSTDTILIQQVKNKILKKVLDNIYQFADEYYESSLDKYDLRKLKIAKFNKKYLKLLTKLFPNVFYTSYIKGEEISGKNTAELAKSIINKILVYSNMLAVKSRRGPATYCLVNGQLGTILQDSVMMNLNTSVQLELNTMTKPYLVGDINGIDIYIDPNRNWNDLSVVLGRNDNSNYDNQIVISHYNVGTDIVLDNNNIDLKKKLIYRSEVFYNGNEKNAKNMFIKFYIKTKKMLI